MREPVPYLLSTRCSRSSCPILLSRHLPVTILAALATLEIEQRKILLLEVLIGSRVVSALLVGELFLQAGRYGAARCRDAVAGKQSPGFPWPQLGAAGGAYITWATHDSPADTSKEEIVHHESIVPYFFPCRDAHCHRCAGPDVDRDRERARCSCPQQWVTRRCTTSRPARCLATATCHVPVFPCLGRAA